MNTFEKMLHIHQPKLRRQIRTCIADKKKEINSKLCFDHDALDRLKSFIPLGKLIRGSLVIIGAELSGKQPSNELYGVGASVEITHAGLLIHDDIMDQDMLRRGQESMWVQYLRLGEQAHARSPRRFGESLGICIGDLTFFLAMELFVRSVASAKEGNSMLTTYMKELELVTSGQMMDVYVGSVAKEYPWNIIESIYRFKTARYSFSLPLMLGALYADAKAQDIQLLAHFGELAGVAFQIRDDGLRFMGDESMIGKSLLSDIRDDKKTLQRKILFERASVQEKKELKQIFGLQTVSLADLKYIKTLMLRYAVHEEVDEYIKQIKKKIEQEFKKNKPSASSEEILWSLFHYVVERTV